MVPGRTRSGFPSLARERLDVAGLERLAADGQSPCSNSWIRTQVLSRSPSPFTEVMASVTRSIICFSRGEKTSFTTSIVTSGMLILLRGGSEATEPPQDSRRLCGAAGV
jgi:hypothetical protein